MFKFLWNLFSPGMSPEICRMERQSDPMLDPDILKMCARELADLPMSAGYFKPDADRNGCS